MAAKRIIVNYLKLGKSRSWGLAHCGTNTVEIDVRAKGKKQLEIINHECLHILFPRLSEAEIVKKSIILTNTLWYEGFRKVDNSNEEALQDGSI